MTTNVFSALCFNPQFTKVPGYQDIGFLMPRELISVHDIFLHTPQPFLALLQTHYVLCLSIFLSSYLFLINQDEGVVMGTVGRDGRGPAGLPDTSSVCGEPVHQGAAGTLHTGKHC